MRRYTRLTILTLAIICGYAGSASATVPATGGTCPTTANMDGGVYAAPTNCFYIDFASGTDTNAGTTEAAPLKHAPGMAGCVSTCAGITPAAGMGFIFKGGVTWDYTIWPWFPSAGGSSGGADSFGGCTGASCVYYGVDKSWFSGASWSRPILSGGDWSNPGTNTACFYDTNTSGNLFLKLSYHPYVIVDNFEFTGMCSTTGATVSGNDAAYLVNSNSSGGTNYTIEHCYFHRAAFPASAPPTLGDYWTAGLFNDAKVHWTYNVVDGTDSGPTTTFTAGHSASDAVWSGEAINSGTVYYDHNVTHNITASIDIIPISVHDNLFLDGSNSPVESNYHAHIAYDNDCTNPQYFYNNVLDTVISGQGWAPNGVGCTYYIFNNIITNETVGRLLSFASGSTVTSLTYDVFNNTMECGFDSAGPNAVCGIWGQQSYVVFNDYFVTTTTSITCGLPNGGVSCASFTDSAGTTTNDTFSTWPLPGNPLDMITQSLSTANGQGYSYGQAYQFSPTAAGNATVGTGVNETSLCNAMGDALASAACKQDTTYAVTYDQTNHTAVSGARTPVNRPSSGAWDVGAYEFPRNRPQSATNVVAKAQ